MAKIDYYKFGVFEPYKSGGECHKTLREAKQDYLNHLKQGHRVGCEICGCTLKDVQEYMGHADIQMTANIYGHLDMQRKQLLTEKMTASLF